jgi:hypothetical protein
MKHLAGFILLFPIAFAGFAKADTNVALAPGAGGTNAGVALFGYDSGAITAPGTEYDHAGSSVYLNDGVTNGNNGDDSWP